MGKDGKKDNKPADKAQPNDKPKMQREKLAGYLYDLSKLTYTAIVLGTFVPILGGSFSGFNVTQLLIGIVATVTFAWFANKLLYTN